MDEYHISHIHSPFPVTIQETTTFMIHNSRVISNNHTEIKLRNKFKTLPNDIFTLF